MNYELQQVSIPEEPLLKFFFYRIHCKETDITDCYIGKTTRFESRISQHKMLSNDSDLKLYRTIAQNGGFNNWICECIHTEICSETASSFIEYAFFKLFQPSLNTRVPRVKLNVFKSAKVDYNRTQCQTHYLIKKSCDCGWIGSKMGYAHHLKSKKHQLWVDVFGDATILEALENKCCENCNNRV